MSDKFSRKKFIANAESFLEEKRAAWVRDMLGTPLEQAALTYAKREFILPNEDLNCVTSLDLFPNADLGEWADKCERDMASREEASKAIRAAVIDGLREANAGVDRVRHGVTEFTGSEAETPPSGSRPPVKPLPRAVEADAAVCFAGANPASPTKSTASGIPSSVASSSIVVHYITIGGMELHSLDRAVMELAQQAQIQKRPIHAEWADSPLGRVIIACHL